MLKSHSPIIYLYFFSALYLGFLKKKKKKNTVSVSIQSGESSFETFQLAFVLLKIDEAKLNICS